MREWLNVDQSPSELESVHGERDYYAYLRSPAFVNSVVARVASEVNGLGAPCLDAGCGDGMLADLVTVPYVGFDGSEAAVERARARRPGADFRVNRLECPLVEGTFPTVVFSGILEVLVRPECRVLLLESYRRRYHVNHFVVCDLLRLDVTDLKSVYRLASETHVRAEMDGVEEVKKDRKVLVFSTVIP